VPEVLDDIDDISIVRFDGHDVVRHKLVQRIVNAYKVHDDQVGAAREQRRAEAERRREAGRRPADRSGAGDDADVQGQDAQGEETGS
jgi:hypothetical protein